MKAGLWMLSPGMEGKRAVRAGQRSGEGQEGGGRQLGDVQSQHRFAWVEPLEFAHTWEVPALWCISPAPPSPPWCRATGNISSPENISHIYPYPNQW